MRNNPEGYPSIIMAISVKKCILKYDLIYFTTISNKNFISRLRELLQRPLLSRVLVQKGSKVDIE